MNHDYCPEEITEDENDDDLMFNECDNWDYLYENSDDEFDYAFYRDEWEFPSIHD